MGIAFPEAPMEDEMGRKLYLPGITFLGLPSPICLNPVLESV